jgi:hypothetical protein
MATARNLIAQAFQDIGAFSPSETIPAADSQGALRRLNAMLGGWVLCPLTMTNIARDVFPLVAGKGGPGVSTPTAGVYTIGPGGDFDTFRPASIYAVGLYNPQPGTPNELPRTLYTDDAYNSIIVKTFQSPYFAGLYYNATYASGWGSINLWPVPSVSTYSLVLYRQVQVSQFADLTTNYALPPGGEDAIEYSLARVLAVPYGRPWTPGLEQQTNRVMGIYTRGNTRMVDLAVDPALTANRGGLWNIESDGLS